jgi:adenosylcobyric acid synthase
VLLKPETDTGAQVIVQGQRRSTLRATDFSARSATLAAAAQAAFDRLAAQHALVVVEGAGSPAEPNLAPDDYVNLEVLRWAARHGPVDALLVADIDRGGAFAHFWGTWSLLPDDLRPRLRGFVANKFRGDASLLAPAPQWLAERTGVPLVAVLPMLAAHGLPDEDGWFGAPPAAGPGDDARRRIAIVAWPRLANLDEFAPLAASPGLRLRWVRRADELAADDLIVLPGSKQVSGDLEWLRAAGFETALAAHVRAGGAVLGICGGLQMLGLRIVDRDGFDGVAGTDITGLGLLRVVTRYAERKHLARRGARFAALEGAWRAWSGHAVEGYEIHHGCSESMPGADARVALRADDGSVLGWQQGPVLGVYLHGLFEQPELVAALAGAAPAAGHESAFDRIADAFEAACDPALLEALFTGDRR